MPFIRTTIAKDGKMTKAAVGFEGETCEAALERSKKPHGGEWDDKGHEDWQFPDPPAESTVDVQQKA